VALTGATSAVTPAGLRPRPYDACVLEILRPGSRRLLAGVTLASGTLLAAACGSPDRGASDLAATPSPVTARSSAGMRPEPITPARLPAYLASHQDTRTFLVAGPLGAISGLHEQFRR
jgi:hypothetical protein